MIALSLCWAIRGRYKCISDVGAPATRDGCHIRMAIAMLTRRVRTPAILGQALALLTHSSFGVTYSQIWEILLAGRWLDALCMPAVCWDGRYACPHLLST